MSCVYHGRTKGDGCGHVKSIKDPPSKGFTSAVVYCCGASAVVYYFCHRMSLHVCPVDLFLFSIAVWPLVWDRNGPFGILFVVF